MSLFDKPVHEFTCNDIQKLIHDKTAESLVLDYKLQMYSHNRAGTKELLCDIAAMANASGGFLIIGVSELRSREQDGIPDKVVGVENGETEALYIRQQATNRIEPQILGFDAVPVSCSNGKFVIVVKIPASYRRPHSARIRDQRYFYIRRGRESSPMEPDEIRRSVLEGQEMYEGVVEFLEKRWGQIWPGDFVGQNRYRLAFLAYPVFHREEKVNVQDSKLREYVESEKQKYLEETGRPNPQELKPCLAGLECRGYWGSGGAGRTKITLFRNGYIEFIGDFPAIDQGENPGPILYDPPEFGFVGTYEQRRILSINPLLLGDFIRYGFVLLKSLVTAAEIIVPYAIGFCVGSAEYLAMIQQYDSYESHSRHPSSGYVGEMSPSQQLALPPKQVSSFDNIDIPMREIMDHVWNAFGFERCPFFDNDGKYHRPLGRGETAI